LMGFCKCLCFFQLFVNYIYIIGRSHLYSYNNA